MSIQSEITRINTNIAGAYTAVSGKGGTLPATQNSNNLASAIATIPTGGGGGGYDVTKIKAFSSTPIYQAGTSYNLPSGQYLQVELYMPVVVEADTTGMSNNSKITASILTGKVSGGVATVDYSFDSSVYVSSQSSWNETIDIIENNVATTLISYQSQRITQRPTTLGGYLSSRFNVGDTVWLRFRYSENISNSSGITFTPSVNTRFGAIIFQPHLYAKVSS